MDLYNLDGIYSLALEPKDKISFDDWATQTGLEDYLENEAKEDYVIIYASLPHTFIHSVFIPQQAPNEEIIKDLRKWSYNPHSSWSQVCTSDEAWIEPPLSNSGSEILKTGEQIIFGRYFEGVNSNKNYYELNQKLAHILGIHFMPERNAWCKLDDHGDIFDVFKIVDIEGLPRNEAGTIICAKKEELSEYVSIESLALIRMFDFTRYKSGDFFGWGKNKESKDFEKTGSIYGSLSVVPGTGSYSRGFQLIDLSLSKKHIVNRIWGDPNDENPKKYCTYIAQDWKNKVITEISCDPGGLANYFTESDLPFEITPVFFKPEVLTKYKSDRAKYKLETRAVGCRASWHLKTFDINSAGQVHTYLIYLSHLPYEEQLHWKQYNEKPKAPLSERAIATDFDGKFYDEYDPLPSLKHKLNKLNSEGVDWWVLRDTNAPGKVHYPYTASKDEWAEEILNLDQLLVEGLQEKWLRKKAKELGCKPDARLRALKLLEVILVALGFEEDHSREIMTPFHVVHNLRSVLKGHTSGTDAENERKNALKEHGSFRNHFEEICSNCDESIDIITEALR
ncbi:MAG: hypothetical protein ACI8SR_000984 [Oceanicoccus sp.]|jgi:hypothetical protein